MTNTKLTLGEAIKRFEDFLFEYNSYISGTPFFLTHSDLAVAATSGTAVPFKMPAHSLKTALSLTTHGERSLSPRIEQMILYALRQKFKNKAGEEFKEIEDKFYEITKDLKSAWINTMGAKKGSSVVIYKGEKGKTLTIPRQAVISKEELQTLIEKTDKEITLNDIIKLFEDQ